MSTVVGPFDRELPGTKALPLLRGTTNIQLLHSTWQISVACTRKY
jgi:hypothetical protein